MDPLTRPANPFGSARTRPGALTFRWPASSQDLTTELAVELKTCHRGAIVGPHGTGKTTLLAELIELLAGGGQLAGVSGQVHSTTLRIGQPQNHLWIKLRELQPGDMLIVDGWEQAGRWLQLAMFTTCWRHGVKLLVSSHVRPWGFRLLVQTSGNQQIAYELAAELLAEYPQVAPQLLANFTPHWQASGGNFRELWGRLYDDFEFIIKQPRSS